MCVAAFCCVVVFFWLCSVLLFVVVVVVVVVLCIFVVDVVKQIATTTAVAPNSNVVGQGFQRDTLRANPSNIEGLGTKWPRIGIRSFG